MNENNIKQINTRIEQALDILKKNYELEERNIGEYASISIPPFSFEVHQYDIKGVGNLLTMKSINGDAVQMNTVVIMPYYKNLPLFSSDYIYKKENRMFLNEIYDLVDYKDDLYNSYIDKFIKNKDIVSKLKDMPTKPCWYDNIRPVLISKVCAEQDDQAILDVYFANLKTFIEMEKASPILNKEAKTKKYIQNYEYARKLIDVGGVSTELFVKTLGPEKTKKFFFEVFFASLCYK